MKALGPRQLSIQSSPLIITDPKSISNGLNDSPRVCQALRRAVLGDRCRDKTRLPQPVSQAKVRQEPSIYEGIVLAYPRNRAHPAESLPVPSPVDVATIDNLDRHDRSSQRGHNRSSLPTKSRKADRGRRSSTRLGESRRVEEGT